MSKLLVIDTETGGLDPDKYSILTLGAVVWHDDPSIKRETFEVEIAEVPIVAEPGALAVNGIDVTRLSREGKNPLVAVSMFHNFVKRHFPEDGQIALAGHNVDFDVRFVKRLFRLAGCESTYTKTFSHRVLDTAGIGRFLVLARRLKLESSSSDALFTFFGIQPEKRHSALGDAWATANLLDCLIEVAKS